MKLNKKHSRQIETDNIRRTENLSFVEYKLVD